MKEKEQRRREREAWEAARGPMDLPFLMLAMMLLGIGLIMLLSASFPITPKSARAQNRVEMAVKTVTIFVSLHPHISTCPS